MHEFWIVENFANSLQIIGIDETKALREMFLVLVARLKFV
jgi:hypothetical protein